MNKISTGVHAFPCYDHVPRTTVPPLTNGGMLRSMDNHHLAAWLAGEAYAAETNGAKTEADYLAMLGKPIGCDESILPPQGYGQQYSSNRNHEGRCGPQYSNNRNPE